ncbi:hypothetical protein CE143_12315 [Photorhabdus luminescens]|uniref:Uncharacterized protein n=1 Tax=Photorhabdus akhurstii TaxID=171438 RepID=A0ABX8LTI6_9GAMM|nr:hypothetical protein [Photorhabdus akhurstii]QXF33839.1 hypothetical protein B0X70_12315 [Photorhabdus akhurstii]UJD75654.1 hypothetical protein CE143_12315 [Photorhabdus luminescens]
MVYEYGKTDDRKRKRSTQSDNYEEKIFLPVLDLSKNNQNTSNMEDKYETPKDFINRTGRKKLFRAIRMIASNKRDPITKDQVSVSPDGNLFTELKDRHLDRAAEYKKLKEWPTYASIIATASSANTPIAQHVSGDDVLSPYISTGDERGAAQNTVRNWNGIGPASERRLRPEKTWSPIIEIDVNKLPDTTKIFDLNKPDNTFFGTANSNIAQNAFADKEVLISPEIPGHSITRVINDPEEIKQIADLNPSQSPIKKNNTILEEKIIFAEKKSVPIHDSDTNISPESFIFSKRKKPKNIRSRTDS